MDDVQIISTENYPPGIGAVSVFDDGIHYIIVNSNLPKEIQAKSIEAEKNAKPF